MLDLTFGQTYGSYDSVPAQVLPAVQQGLGNIVVCIKNSQCVNELTFDLVVGQGTCPTTVRDTIRFRVDIAQPLQPQADIIINNINQMLPMLSISWTSVLNTTSFTLTGFIAGNTALSGSVYGDYNTTVTLTYANPVLLNNRALIPGTPFLINVSDYPANVRPPVTSSTGINTVSSGAVGQGSIACPTPAPGTPAAPCPTLGIITTQFVGVVGASKGQGQCGIGCQEIITRGTVKIKLGKAIQPDLYSSNNWKLPGLYISYTTLQFEIHWSQGSNWLSAAAPQGCYPICQIRTLEITPFTAVIIL